MDVDTQPSLSLHPVRSDEFSIALAALHSHTSLFQLAIVSMSDQFTRISKGGTPLNPTDPVVGLLFGKSSDEEGDDTGTGLEICDAVDLPSRTEDASTIVALHQAVYTHQRVVGCYRVVECGSKDAEPMAEDLAQTQGTQAAGALFLLLRVQKSGTKSNSKTTGEEGNAPISIFQLIDGALVHQSDWRLKTASPEKIAVERVMQEQRHAKDKYAKQLASKTQLQDSLTVFQERMIVVENYLNSPEPKDPTILRKIQALLLKARLVHQQDAVSAPAPLLRELESLTTFAETLDIGRLYTTTLKTAHSAPGGRRQMRAALRK